MLGRFEDDASVPKPMQAIRISDALLWVDVHDASVL